MGTIEFLWRFGVVCEGEGLLFTGWGGDLGYLCCMVCVLGIFRLDQKKLKSVGGWGRAGELRQGMMEWDDCANRFLRGWRRNREGGGGCGRGAFRVRAAYTALGRAPCVVITQSQVVGVEDRLPGC